MNSYVDDPINVRKSSMYPKLWVLCKCYCTVVTSGAVNLTVDYKESSMGLYH